jgi:hypothetical protein
VLGLFHGNGSLYINTSEFGPIKFIGEFKQELAEGLGVAIFTNH